MLPFGLQFGFPLALLGLPLLALLPRRPGLPVRMVASALLLVALAQPSIRAASDRVALLVDVSDSVGDGGLEAARELDLSALPTPPEVVYVAGDSARVPDLQAAVPTVVLPQATDLARALQVAAGSGAKRALLVSDGIESRGSALDALPDLPVDVLAVPRLPNVRLSDLLLPEEASPGQRVEAVAVLRSDAPGRVTVRGSVGGAALDPVTLDIEAGTTAVPFTFTVGDGSSLSVAANVEVSFPQPTGDDHKEGQLEVRARPPVLVIGDPAMARLLRSQGIAVEAGSQADVRAPIEAGAVVLRGNAAQFTPGQLDLLRQYVEDGGGLIMTGGPESFGLGGWYRTPVEEVLPVTTDLRTEVSLPLVALVIVLDRSQSMSSGSPSRLELAKEGALQVVDLAYKDDLLGLIAFSDPNSTRWAFQLREATERGKREMLQAILAIDPGGGTVLEPAYRQAIDALEATDAAVKHIIVLSDGKLYDGQGPFGGGAVPDFDGIASGGLADGITTSAIAIGADADFERLQDLADAGGGRYYAALDVSTLPRIFTNEALTATRALYVDEVTTPLARPNPLLTFPADVPSVDGYVATSLKPEAQALLEGRRQEPILATGRAGLGRTAALTTDLNASAGAFGRWQALPGDLATLMRWLQARPLVYKAVARHDGGQIEVVVDAVEGGEYLNNKSLRVRFGGASAAMQQVAPGRYEARLSAPPDASGTVVVSEGATAVARARIGGPDPEFAEVDGGALLRRIAERSGGRVLQAGEPYQPASVLGARALWPYLAMAALALFMLELAWRRLAGRGAPGTGRRLRRGRA